MSKLIRVFLPFGLLAAAASLFAFLPAPTDLADPGPYLAGWRNVTVEIVPGRSYLATIYYPAQAPGGQNAPLDASGGPYPAISFGHGFLQAVSSYASTLQHLATWGFIVIAPQSEGGLFPNHSNFANDLRDCLTYLTQENNNPASFLYQAVNPDQFGVSGHSMGGGASLLAASRDSRIKAVSNLAAAETNPSAIAATSLISRPVQIIAGSQDSIVPPATSQQPMYAAANPAKQAPLIIGGWHCGFQDSSFPIGCDTGDLPRAEQLAITRRLLTGWFRLYLQGETALWPQVWGPPARQNSQVTFTGDDGISLTPATQSGTVTVGERLTYTVTISNSGVMPTAYALAVESVWPGGVISQTGVVPVGAAANLSFWVEPVAAGQAPLTLTVRSLYDGGTTDWHIATTSAAASPPSTQSLFLPLLLTPP
ncbi:MAG: dienelactone hydrolase family protein [Anaerolineae bacterium]|nr:dienelactone hydrolase family protein [Anaerolineae bacterium]